MAAVVWAGVAAVAAVVAAAVGADVGVWVGVGALAFTASAVGVLAWSAWSAMLRAGERGERLSSDDVGLLPPRRRRP